MQWYLNVLAILGPPVYQALSQNIGMRCSLFGAAAITRALRDNLDVRLCPLQPKQVQKKMHGRDLGPDPSVAKQQRSSNPDECQLLLMLVIKVPAESRDDMPRCQPCSTQRV